ncbi:DUF1684 domain-containing protein [Botryobacter ruber]|uniref:DUF1684 domain-containing protein n=1 Tax=Botryobacter ruber TaxID=2171629 RepID=UPI000E0A822C|nr:DUF1684 domain-containing protein [Botryobacter ruber]
MKHILLTFFLIAIVAGQAVAQSYKAEIAKFQQEMNDEFLNSEKSPLTPSQKKKFTGHSFFPIDSAYRVVAKFVKAEASQPFRMKTTTSRLPVYEKYGEAVFELDGKFITLGIYQSHQLRETEEYRNYLFLPFTDLTNGKETYGGGRYIDLSIPEGDTIVIDFNKAYSPSCAYNSNYSCPIPPKENALDIPITAGTKFLGK